MIGGVWRWTTGSSTPSLNGFLGLLLFAWIPLTIASYFVMGDLWRRLLSGERRTASEHPANAELTRADLKRLPASLDLVGTSARDRDAAKAIADPVLRKIVEALPRWRPTQTRYEAQYQAALARFLRRHLRGHDIEEQFPLEGLDQNARTRRRRVDIVIDRTIAIEIKPRIDRSADIHRTVGQVREYSEMWGTRGPVLLLVCETAANFEASFAARSLANREGGRGAAMVIAAGIRV
ncbi:MAG: hypothetical protein IPK80_28675 [Nannocystis sp.]|nr:hypothetical protein [Nannocystis sp.]